MQEYEMLAENARNCVLQGKMSEEIFYQYLEMLADDILRENVNKN